jgi:hypothetical protein
MTAHTYKVTLSVQCVKEMLITVDDDEPVWREPPSEETRRREAAQRAYGSQRGDCYVMDIEKVSP